MRDHLIKQIKEGVPVKAIAYDEGLCRSYVYSLAQSCGFAAMLVDANERRVINDMRRRAK